MKLEEKEQKEKFLREEENELLYEQEAELALEKEKTLQTEQEKHPIKYKKLEGEDTLMNRMAQWKYSSEQKSELQKMIAAGMPKETILTVFYPDTDVTRMQEIRKTFCLVQEKGE